jgi:hypothetical protein
MLQLTLKTPRAYPTVEIFKKRVWRLKSVLFCKELIFWLSVLILLSSLMQLSIGIYVFLGIVLLIFLGLITHVWLNFKRLAIIRTGIATKGKIMAKRNLPYFHELLRGKAHRSMLMQYSYEVNGKTYTRDLALCRCASDKFEMADEVDVAYDPNHPEHSVLLRVAVLVIPH